MHWSATEREQCGRAVTTLSFFPRLNRQHGVNWSVVRCGLFAHVGGAVDGTASRQAYGHREAQTGEEAVAIRPS